MARMSRVSWNFGDGACLEHPGVQFVLAQPVTEANASEARAICSGCLCREECLGYALADSSLQGIWGGTSTAERREMRRQTRVA